MAVSRLIYHRLDSPCNFFDCSFTQHTANRYSNRILSDRP